MGYYGKVEEKLQVQNLRKKGKSYSEIMMEISVSKNSISRWCRDITLSEAHLDRIYNKKRNGGVRGALIGSKRQQEKRIRDTLLMYQQGKSEIAAIEKRDRFIAGVALYLAEGTKADRVCEFANTDPLVIKFMSAWFEEFCSVDVRKQHGAIWIHEGRSEPDAKIYWSRLTGIPTANFHKTYFVKSNKEGSYKKNIHPFGVFSIRFSSANVHRKIMGWICGLLGDAWYNNRIAILQKSPVAQSVEQEAVEGSSRRKLRDE